MSILYPALAMFLLTLFVLLRLGSGRRAAVMAGKVDGRYYRTYANGAEPDELQVISRHLINLHETPLLFYVILLIAFVSGQHGLLPVGLAWAYVVARYAHSYVHLSSNRVPLRFKLFVLSIAILAALWIVVFAGMALS